MIAVTANDTTSLRAKPMGRPFEMLKFTIS
jgi:hypothetical protein